MTIRMQPLGSLSGLGNLGGASSSMKTKLNALELATGTTGRYNAGDASSDSLSGDRGYFVFRATYHLIDDASSCGGELAGKAAMLSSLISSKLGKALGSIDSAISSVVGVIGDSLELLDKSKSFPIIGSVSVARAVWTADQVFEGWLQDFLESASSEIGSLAAAYLAVRKKGQCGGSSGSSGSSDSLTPFQRLAQQHKLVSVGIPNTALAPPPIIRPTPPAKSKAPVIVIGGAAIAAAILLTR